MPVWGDYLLPHANMLKIFLTRYTDKRIQLRKNRYLAMQRMMEEKRQEVK